MNQLPPDDYTSRLRSHMQTAGISSYKELRQQAAVSEWQIKQLRQGKAAHLRAGSLHRVSQVLRVSIAQLLAEFSHLFPDSEPPSDTSVPLELERLKQEYQRLQGQLVQQREMLWQEFQQSSLQALESWLIQFPTAAYAAQANPTVPAVRLLPLMRPMEQLLQDWHVEAIAPVGAELPYDPQMHQLIEGTAEAGDRVRVRYVGYRQGDKILYRVKVSPVISDGAAPEAST